MNLVYLEIWIKKNKVISDEPQMSKLMLVVSEGVNCRGLL